MSTEIKNRKSISASQKYFDDLAKAGYPQSADYQQILFKPGKALQSRELNFLQSIINEKIKNSNDLIYKNGSVIFGCDVEIDGSDITVGDGVIYWDGTFFKFTHDTITTVIDIANGINVYLQPKYETIDYSDDSKLYDPAIIYKINKSIDGADRLKISFEIKDGDATDDEYSEVSQIIQIATINNSGVTLINRYPFVVDQDIQLDSKIISGLRVRNNPMREPFSINENNETFYNTATFEKAFVEVEEGTGIINGEEIVNSESRVFQLNKSVSSNDSDKLIRNEKKIQSLNKDLIGLYGDISYGGSYIDRKTFLVDMLQPGKEAKIKIRVPLKKTVDGVTTTEYKIFEVCTCEVADVYDLWKNEVYEGLQDDNRESPVGIGITPIPINKFEIDNEITKYNVISSEYNGSTATPDSEFIYDTSDDWKVHLITAWQIYLKTGGSIHDISTWDKIEYMVVVNKLYDAAGQEVNTKGLTLTPSNLIHKNALWPRESGEVIGSDLTYPPNVLSFNSAQVLPGQTSIWVDSAEDDTSTIFFFFDTPSSWISKGYVPSDKKIITCKASNPFVFPGNMFSDGEMNSEILNIPMGGTIYKDNEGRFNIPNLRKVLNPIKDISSIIITTNVKNNKINNINSFNFANISNSDLYVYNQSNVAAMFNLVSSNPVRSLLGDQIFTELLDVEKIGNKNCILFHEFYDKITIVYE